MHKIGPKVILPWSACIVGIYQMSFNFVLIIALFVSLVLICCERKILVAGVDLLRERSTLVAGKPGKPSNIYLSKLYKVIEFVQK